MTKTKRETGVSPLGTIKYSHLTTPNTKFKANGEYSVDLLIDPKDPNNMAFLDNLRARAKASHAAYAADGKDGKQQKARAAYDLHLPYMVETDDEGNETGLVVLKVKNDAVVKINKGPKAGQTFEKKPILVDAKRSPIIGKKIGRGTEGKAAFTMNAFGADGLKKAGLGLWLEGFQVTKMVEYGGNDAAVLGFGEEEGYVDEGTDELPFTQSVPNETPNPDFA